MSTKKEVDDWWAKKLNEAAPFGKSEKPYKRLGKDSALHLPLLIDGDIVAYRAAAPCDGRGYAITRVDNGKVVASERYKKEIMKIYDEQYSANAAKYAVVPTKNPEPEHFAIYNIDQIMSAILDKYPKAWVRVYLTGNQNFRTELNPEYKANRATQERPVHLSAAKQYLLNRYGAIIEDLYEADDLIGIEARRLYDEGRNFRIVTIDKDLNCIPGGHYNFVKDEDYEVSEEEAVKFFYTQCLTGDKTDNIEGINGIGPVKAQKIINEALEGFSGNKLALERAYYIAVLKAWSKFTYPDKPEGEIITQDELQASADRLQRSAELLWILQNRGEMWSPPITIPELLKQWEDEWNALVKKGKGSKAQ